MNKLNTTNEMKISLLLCCKHFNEDEYVCYYNSDNFFNDIMFFNEEYNIILINDYWGRKLIPAVLRKENGILEGRSDVWIPDGYDGCSSGGYSTRLKNDIKKFNLSDEIKNDIIKQWEREIKRQEVKLLLL